MLNWAWKIKMAAERKSLNSVIENGKDAQLSEDILNELNNTRRSVRQQAIKLLKEVEEQDKDSEENSENSQTKDGIENVQTTKDTAGKKPQVEDSNKSLQANDSSQSLQAKDSNNTPQSEDIGQSLQAKDKSKIVLTKDNSHSPQVEDSSLVSGTQDPLMESRNHEMEAVGMSEGKELDSPATPQKRGRGRPRKRKTGTPGRSSADSSAEGMQRESSSEVSDKQRTCATDSESDVEASKSQEATVVSKESIVAAKETVVAVKETVSSEGIKGSPLPRGTRINPERSVRMSPLKSIPAAQRKAVNAKVSSTDVKQKLELSNKDASDTMDGGETDGGSGNESRRKRRRAESDTDDGEEKDESERRETRQRKAKDEEQQNDNTDSEKEEPKRKRGRPRKNPVPVEAEIKEKEQIKEDSKISTDEESIQKVDVAEGKETLDLGTHSEQTGDHVPEKAGEDNNDEDESMETTAESKSEEDDKNHDEPSLAKDSQIKVASATELVRDTDVHVTDASNVCQTIDNTLQTKDKEIHGDIAKVPVPSTESVRQNGATKETIDTVKTVETPDTDSLKFVPDNVVLESTPQETSDADDTSKSTSDNTLATSQAESTTTKEITKEDDDTDHSEPMITDSSVAATKIPTISGADAAANDLPSSSSSADFPVGTAGSVTPQKAAAQDAKERQNVSRKVKPKPRRSMGKTHFGMKRSKKKRSNYEDSDSTDVQSECSTDGQPAMTKKYRRFNSTSTHTESEDDRSSHSSVNKGRTNIPALPDALASQAEPPLCSCKMEWDKPPSSNVTSCNAHEVINNKLGECGKSVDGLKVLRPSTRVGFKTLCDEHRRKMSKHQCCPGCGCFCSAGIMMMCTVEETNHHFHKECIKEIDGTLYCPHCGENASLAKEVTLPSTEELEQLKCVPKNIMLNGTMRLPRVLLARLTGMSSKALAAHLGEEEDLQTPKARMRAPVARKGEAPLVSLVDIPDDLPSKSITLKSGITISSATLPPGTSRDALETALQFLDTESPKRLRFFPKNLYLSTSQGDLDKVLQMLGDGFDPNYRFPSHNHETALHVAAAKGHLEIMSMLLQSDANIDPTDEDHRTPLHVATENNQVLCMKYLVKHGANPQHRDDDGMSILHAAAKIGSIEAIQFILSLRNVSINVQDDGGWTPIIWAAESKNIPVVEYLIERGADPNIRDKEGNSALHWASFAGADRLSELFLGRGCDVQAVNVHGDSPLHIAARENFYAVVTMLLMRSADISIRNKEGETPLDCTAQKSDIYLAMQVNKRMKYAVSKRTMKTEKIISRDISRGMEVHPIPVVNAVDEESVPDDFLYVSESCETSRLNIDRNIKHMQGCLCTNDCALETCTCARSSVQCWYSSEGRLLPEFNFHEPPMIFECGRACFCWRNCRNRVVQNGIKTHLVLFRTPKMGWGIRTTQDIKQGTFICEYAGELISDADADQREDDSYLFDLDNREGDVYCIDARFYGNISRFINHLCEPNIVPVRVFIDHHDLRFPRISFFTSRDIRANEELGFDYGDKFWAIKSKFFTCCCGSRLCKHSQPIPELFNETNKSGLDV